tara:strand:+ start:434 stop:580 length:147 start_codon:yes stop_codon:yes gene_type:complete
MVSPHHYLIREYSMSDKPEVQLLDAPIFKLLDLMEYADDNPSPSKEKK